MNRAWVGLSVVFAMLSSSVASAQDMTFTEEQAETEAGQEGGGEAGQEGGGEAGQGGGEAGQEGGGDIIGELATERRPEAGPAAPTARRRELVEEIYAVQQIWALRTRRVELTPQVGFSLNDPFVSHYGVGVGLNYWFTNVLAVGLNFVWYQELDIESDLNFRAGRATRLVAPINEYQLAAAVNFSYVPLYGKFAMFNEFIFHWDAYVTGGVGIIRTRPIPVFDPDVRTFDYGFRIAFNVALGLRVFVTRFLAIGAELRDYIYLEQLESQTIATGADRNNESTWEGDAALTNHVALNIGLSLFFPFEFTYERPR
ncbi:MAG: outer membrane beta-barrel domain-containing protein [Deltaproteobacteria bacterium]|nr:outer membrane beta-barrel domain-containing protein [Deltaproteobacteria bacterium]